jgi:DNA-directed RNA polymerase specialized sigma24 family protein
MTYKDVKALEAYMELLKVRDSLNLSDRQREIFDLRYHHGLSLLQISMKLNCSFSLVSKESMEIARKLKTISREDINGRKPDEKRVKKR